MYNDVPAIELGSEDYPAERFPLYAPVAESSPYLMSVDPGLTSQESLSTCQTNTSAHLVNMEKHILHLANSAYGYGLSPVFNMSNEDSSSFGFNTRWGSEDEAHRTMRYTSPNGSWRSSLSSEYSTSSDYAFSPDVSRPRTSLYHDDLDSQVSSGSSYLVPFSQTQYSYTSHGSCSGRVIDSAAPRDQAVACTMKELQYNPDPENEDILENRDFNTMENSRPQKIVATPEGCFLATETPSRSEHEDFMKDEDDEQSTGSDVDQEYSPARAGSTRRVSPSNKRPARSPPVSRQSFMRPKIDDNRVLKPSQRPSMSTKSKTKTVSRRRPNNKNGDSRPFICSFSHYGCESRFSSKNEWKRHVSTQHLQLGFYRCDTGTCNPDDRSSVCGNRVFNDFNRKDLFIQHHRRMHTPWTPANKPPSKKMNDDFEEGLEAVRQRCWHVTRQAPKKSCCIFCPVRFDGDSAWEERMEHIGKHFEKAEREKQDIGEGEEDPELRMWALEQAIVVDAGHRGCWLEGLQGSRGTGKAATSAMTTRGRMAQRDEEEDAMGDDE